MSNQSIIKIFDDFHRKINSKFGRWTSNNTDSKVQIFEKDLTITNNLDIINEIYTKYGAVQLRHLSDEKILIVGCGNNPIFLGDQPLTEKYQLLLNNNIDKTWIEYCKNHFHPNCYTINPDIGMNPSIIGEFGINDFKFLPQGFFKEIIFEGFLLDASKNTNNIFSTDNVCTVSTIVHLLEDNGVVSFKLEKNPEIRFVKINNKLKHKHLDILITDDSPDNYYNFYKGMIFDISK